LTYAYGRTKLSSKGVKLKSEVTQLWTRTGVLGLRLYLTYNLYLSI
jgi:hypothetical protein